VGSQWCNRLPLNQEDAPMSEQASKVRNKAVPEWAEGLYYNKGMFSEALVYHDEESLFFECRGKDSGVVRFTFDMIEGLKKVEEEDQFERTLKTKNS
jgi:hypothetical protein